MIKNNEIEKIIYRLKKAASHELEKGCLNSALELVSCCAKIIYETNIKYTDFELENILDIVSKKSQISLLKKKNINNNIIIFFDGFGLDNRGLAQIYLKALCSYKRVVYVTYDKNKKRIPNILKILDRANASSYFINEDKKFLDIIQQLNEIILCEKPGSFFLYSTPHDVVATVILNAYKDILRRYQINLTDHAFWLGSRCIDTCIEFRDYGARITSQYRNIEKDRIVKLPFYPLINEEETFQGYPFEVKANTKVIFSGGALYKTIDSQNTYYQMVDHLLCQNEDYIFWYAGQGNDYELKRLGYKHPNRVFHTYERSDLFQVMKSCTYYLNTYPISGGLMMQYAARAGKVPLTLGGDEDVEGYLLKQDELKIVFQEKEDLFAEAERLITDEKYYELRAIEMEKAVIKEADFENRLKNILNGVMEFNIEYKPIDTTYFRTLYLERVRKKDLELLVASKKTLRTGIKYMPMYFIKGSARKVWNKILKGY